MAGNPYTWSTTPASNDVADSAVNWQEGQLPGTVNDSARGMMAGIAGWLQDTNASLTTGGSANAYTVTSNVAYSALATGLRLRLKLNFTNTGAATLNLTPSGGAAFGAKAIRVVRTGGSDSDVVAGDLQNNAICELTYDAAANSAAGAWIVTNPATAAGPISTPQGRLTLTTATPVLTSTTSAQTTIYYTPYVGRLVPLYDGTSFSMVDTGGELSQATTDTTKSPAAVTTNSNYDLFVWNDSGTIRCTRGPAWSSSTARGTGAGTTELQQVQGIWTNKVAITNGPGANKGTYVGSVRSNGSSQIDYIFGASAAGGTAGFFGVWNMYNRVEVRSLTEDSTSSWTYNSATARSANNSTGNRASFISGLAEDCIMAEYHVGSSATVTASTVAASLDSTNSLLGQYGLAGLGGNSQNAVAKNSLAPQLGFHFIQAVEQSGASGTNTFSGAGYQGLHFAMRM